MIHILFYSAAIVFFSFMVGYGPAIFLLPTHLRIYAHWYAPWIGFALIAVLGSLMSYGHIPMIYATYIILTLGCVVFVIAWRHNTISVALTRENLFLLLGTIIGFIFMIYPLLNVGYPTVISFGNVDPVSYSNVADYLVHHTVWEGRDTVAYTPSVWAVGDLVHYSFRWGSPLIISFFSTLFHVRAYQIFSILLPLFLALTFPVLVIFTKIVTEKFSWLVMLILFLTYTFNATLAYLLFHVFFAQFIFTGIYICIVTILFSIQPSKSFLSIEKSELLLGLLIASVSTIYPEGSVFIYIPFAIGSGIHFISKKRDYRYLIFFGKIVLLSFFLNQITFMTAIQQNAKIIFSTSRNTFIGWENIRHASPIELLGFYNLYHYKPLPRILIWITSMPIIAVWLYGLWRMKHKIWLLSFVGTFLLTLLHFVINSPNFFLFHRTFAYSLFFFAVFFAVGITDFLSLINKKILTFCAVVVMVGLTYRSYNRTWSQFYWHNIVVDKKIISLESFNKDVAFSQVMYTADIYVGEYNLWERLWQEYMLKDKKIISLTNLQTEKDQKRLPKDTIVLTNQDVLNNFPSKIQLRDVLWKNEYYKIGHIKKNDIKETPQE